MVASSRFTALVHAADTNEDKPPIVEKLVPVQVFLSKRQAIQSLDQTSAIEWTVVPRLKRVLKALGYDPMPPIAIHVRFEGPNYQNLVSARYSAREMAVAALADADHAGDLAEFTIEQSEPFLCLSLVFSGSPLESTKYWSVLYDELKIRKLIAAGENREIGLYRTGFDTSKYLTELQLGIKAHK